MAITDKQRVDFLQRIVHNPNPKGRDAWPEIGDVTIYGSYGPNHVALEIGDNYLVREGRDLRAAVDAAMTAVAQKERKPISVHVHDVTNGEKNG